MIMKTILSRVSPMLMLLFISFACIIFSPITVYAAAAGAPVIADSPCDEKYYESMAARAWLEAQREITQNQNIILKPDSVFEYTCFDRLLWELADHADQMLSDTSNYGSPLGSNSMDDALEALILGSLKPYMVANFEYYDGLLGGHPAGLGIKHIVEANIDASSPYSCDIMSRVWQAAKCINFITEAEYDGFFPFEEYASNDDKRHLPTACTPIAAEWQNNINVALVSGPWTNDPVQTYLGQLAAEDCAGGNCPCSGDPIPTGVEVTGQAPGPINYDEYVCLQAGCRYHPGGAPLISGGGDVASGCYGK